MKRYIKTKPIKIIKITIDIDYSGSYVAASGQEQFSKMLGHPSIKKRYKRTDEWLNDLNDLAASIFMAIKGRKFNLLKQWYSKKSYIYYFRFQRIDDSGNIYDQEFEIQLELREHPSKTHDDHGEITPNIAIKSYNLDDARYSNRIELLKAIWQLLDELEKGNYDALM